MPNMKNIVDGHNKKVLEKSTKKESTDGAEKLCNCRSPSSCPMKGQCLTESIIYQATVTTNESERHTLD